MTDQTLSRLVRTLRSYFRIGTIRIKDSSAVVQLRNAGDTAFVDGAVNRIRVQGANASNAVILTAPGALGASPVFTLPAADGGSGTFLQTNGAGELSFASPSIDAQILQQEAFTQATTSPVTIFTPPANSTIISVIIELDSAAAASGASLSVGVAGTVDRYMAAGDVDMQTAGIYQVDPMYTEDGTPEAVILTITPGAQNFSGTVFVKYAVGA